MNLGAFFATFVAGVFIALCAFFIATRGPLAADGWHYQDLVTIMLSAITVVLGALGLGVALVAIWGYDRIKEAAKEVAGKTANTHAETVATAVAAQVASTVAAREIQAYLASQGDAITKQAADQMAAAFNRNAARAAEGNPDEPANGAG